MAESVRLTARRAQGRLGFRFSSPRAFQTRSRLGFWFGIPRVFQPRPLGLGWARCWSSRVEIAQPALSEGRRLAGAAQPRNTRLLSARAMFR